MTLPLIFYGDALLRYRAAPVERFDDALKELVRALVLTMDAHAGCGLAAPQVGHSLRLFVIRAPEKEVEDTEQIARAEPRAFINPKIFDPSSEMLYLEEGCLSIPGVNADIARPKSIGVEYFDVDGQRYTTRFEGFFARVFMHENDHLNGRLFIDRVSTEDRRSLHSALQSLKRRTQLGRV